VHLETNIGKPCTLVLHQLIERMCDVSVAYWVICSNC